MFSYLKARFLRKSGRFGAPTPKFRFLENMEYFSNFSILSTYSLKVITLTFQTKKNYVPIFKIDRIVDSWIYRKKTRFRHEIWRNNANIRIFENPLTLNSHNSVKWGPIHLIFGALEPGKCLLFRNYNISDNIRKKYFLIIPWLGSQCISLKFWDHGWHDGSKTMLAL